MSETPVAICITEAGDIIVATSTLLYVWSINGDLLSSRKVCNSELDGVTVLEVSRVNRKKNIKFLISQTIRELNGMKEIFL